MLSPRWIKLMRDVQVAPGRLVIMLLAMAAGVFGLATLLSSHTLLKREVSRNYLSTNPASASLQVEGINPAVLAGVRQFPNIAYAQMGARVQGSIYGTDGVRHPLIVFVIDDFTQMDIHTIFAEAGAIGPQPNSLLLERNSLKALKAQLNGKVQLQLGANTPMSVAVAGTVHDPATAFSNYLIYAYADIKALRSLGLDIALTELNIRVRDHALNAQVIEQTASDLAHYLVQQGCTVGRIRIPPPGEHPHQGIMFGVADAFLVFSVTAFLLGVVLMATMIGALMARQMRQIGVMKTLGATSWQIAALYLSFVCALGIVASLVGIPSGIVFGRTLAQGMLVNWLNFNMQNLALPISIYVYLIIAGVLVPIAIAAVPIINAACGSAQRVLTRAGTGSQYFPASGFGQWLTGVIGNRSLLMAVRNSLRSRGNLLLVLALLASAGAVFMSSLNMRLAVQHQLIEAAAERHYDLEIQLATPADQHIISALLLAVPGVSQVEPYSQTPAARHRADGLNIETTYPDGSHGAIKLASLAANSNFLSLPVLSGRSLDPAGVDEVVLNHKAKEVFAAVKLGDQITLGVAGRAAQLRVVGFAQQKMTGAMAYVAPVTYQKLTGQNEQYTNFRLVMQDHTPAAVAALAKQIESALEQQHFYVIGRISEQQLRNEVDGHFTLLINVLLQVATLIALVGMFGLGSALGTQVVQRTAEFGVMRSMGADSPSIMRIIIIEGIFIALISWPLALLVSVLLSKGIGYFLGNLFFSEAFDLALSAPAALGWLFIVVSGAALACWYPAYKATRITVRESFGY